MRRIYHLVTLALLAGITTSQNSGDNHIAHLTITPLPTEVTDELLDIAALVDPETAAAIRDATDPATGTIVIARISDLGWVGAHDTNTIAVSPKVGLIGQYPKWVCGLGLLHEWAHIQNIPPGSPPGSKDPSTYDKGNPCKDCNHARMAARDLDNMALLSFLDGHAPSCTEFCKHYCETYCRGKSLWKMCLGAAAPCVGPTTSFESLITHQPRCACTCPCSGG